MINVTVFSGNVKIVRNCTFILFVPVSFIVNEGFSIDSRIDYINIISYLQFVVGATHMYKKGLL